MLFKAALRPPSSPQPLLTWTWVQRWRVRTKIDTKISNSPSVRGEQENTQFRIISENINDCCLFFFFIKKLGDSFVEHEERLWHESTGYPKGALSYWDMLMITPQNRKVGVKEEDMQRHMENGMDRRRERERERRRKGYDNHFCVPPSPPSPPTQTIKWAYPWRALPRLPRSPLWKWNPHLNTHDDIWIHLSESMLMGRRGNGGQPFCGAKSATHIQINIYIFFCHSVKNKSQHTWRETQDLIFEKTQKLANMLLLL